jgi:hypothetical protein
MPTSSSRPGSRAARASPDSIAEHPRLFVTFTALSFGRVHTRKAQGRLVLPCHPHHQGARCAHGAPRWLLAPPRRGRSSAGGPLRAACCDTAAQVLWNALAPELWRRTTIALQRALTRRVGLWEGELRRLV